MGAYDSRIFSKMFVERTRANYQYISSLVKRDGENIKIQGEFSEQLKKLVNRLEDLKKEFESAGKK